MEEKDERIRDGLREWSIEPERNGTWAAWRKIGDKRIRYGPVYPTESDAREAAIRVIVGKDLDPFRAP